MDLGDTHPTKDKLLNSSLERNESVACDSSENPPLHEIATLYRFYPFGYGNCLTIWTKTNDYCVAVLCVRRRHPRSCAPSNLYHNQTFRTFRIGKGTIKEWLAHHMDIANHALRLPPCFKLIRSRSQQWLILGLSAKRFEQRSFQTKRQLFNKLEKTKLRRIDIFGQVVRKRKSDLHRSNRMPCATAGSKAQQRFRIRRRFQTWMKKVTCPLVETKAAYLSGCEALPHILFFKFARDSKANTLWPPLVAWTNTCLIMSWKNVAAAGPPQYSHLDCRRPEPSPQMKRIWRTPMTSGTRQGVVLCDPHELAESRKIVTLVAINGITKRTGTCRVVRPFLYTNRAIRLTITVAGRTVGQAEWLQIIIFTSIYLLARDYAFIAIQ